MALPPFTSNPLLTPSSPTADQPSLYLFQQPQLPNDFPVSSDPALPSSLSSQLNPPPASPLNTQLSSRLSAQLGLTPNTEGLLPLEDGPPLLDSQMDSQIALHQEVLFQNDFVLKRTNGEQNPAEEDAALPLNLDGVQPLPFSAGDEDFSINALLSGPTVGGCGDCS